MVKLFYSRRRQDSPNKSRVALSSTVLAAFFWGTSFIIVELGLNQINPYWFAQLRFVIASAGALAVTLILKKRIERKLILGRWIWLLGLFNALGFVGQFVGQTMTNATKTALLINLNLVTVALISTIFLDERFSKQKGVAVFFAFFGVFLLTTNGDLSQLGSGEFMGDMFALAGGFSWAFYIVANKKVVSKPGTDVVTLTACVMLATTLWLVPISITLGGFDSSIFSFGLDGFGYIFYLGIFCNVIPFMLWTFGLKYLSATSSTILLLLEVLVATVLAMIILNEFLTMIGLLGGAFIILAIILINVRLKVNKN